MNKGRKGKRGMPLYARICAHLAADVATSRELADALEVGLMGMVKVMRIMRRYRLVYVADWRSEVAYGIPNEVWVMGSRPDAPPPLTQKGYISKKLPNYSLAPISVEAGTFARAVVLLREECTYHDIMEATGLHHSTLGPFIKQLRSLSLIHTCAWIRNQHGTPTPILSWGERYSSAHVNAPRPKRIGKDPVKRLQRQHREKFRDLSMRIANHLPSNRLCDTMNQS